MLERAGNNSTSLPLGTLETLLCAAFSSKHRHIVNSALVMWNQIFGGHVGEVDYPEKLKEALTTLQAFVDVSIPGLDVTHIESGGAQKPMFVDYQDGLDAVVVTLSSAGSNMNEIATPRPTSSKLHFTPTQTPLAATSPSSVNRVSNGSEKKKSNKDKSRRDKSKSTPPRPRHDDSQIEFTTIDFASAVPRSSGAVSTTQNQARDITVIEESQVLTERQREVRDRQRETNALYSDVMSSSPSGDTAARKLMTRTVPARESGVPLPQRAMQPALDQPSHGQEKQTSSPPPEDVALPEQLRTATPEPTTAETGNRTKNGDTFTDEEFIASTPTPRRGQALVFPVTNDNEIDSPSSPPEPRRYPLLPEISSRSRSSSILDEWQFSSSPLSGSPIAARHTMPEPELSLDGILNAGLRSCEEQAVEGEEMAQGRPETTEQSNLQQAIRSLVSGPLASKPDGETDIAMEDVPVPIPALLPATSSQKSLTVEISPIAQKKSKPIVPPSTPMQTRRRSTLLQGTSQDGQHDDENSTGAISFSSSVPGSAPQSLPGIFRKSKRSASKVVAQSSPIRGSTSGRRYKLMAMPPPSMRDVSFRMSDGEERSMLRLAIELDMIHKRSQSSPITAVPPSTRSGSKIEGAADGVEALDCITVSTSEETNWKINDNDATSSPERSQRTPSQRSSRRKRKRSASVRAEGDVAKPTINSSPTTRKYAHPKRHGSESEAERSQKNSSPVPEASPPPLPIEEVADTTAEVGFSSPSKGAELSTATEQNPPTDENVVLVPEDEEVQSQLALELEVLRTRNNMNANKAEKDNVVDLTAVAETTTANVVEVSDHAEPDSVVEVVEIEQGQNQEQEREGRPAKKPRLASILSMLKGSMSLLQSATLSREEVGQIEDVCMDMKRALYDAERRGRE